jgi:Zn-dependent protease with chaperone function
MTKRPLLKPIFDRAIQEALMTPTCVAIIIGVSIIITGVISFLFMLNLVLSRTAENVTDDLAAAKMHAERGREVAKRIEARIRRRKQSG